MIHRAPYLTGLDVSGWQTSIDYDAAAADGIAYVWVKAGQGNTNQAQLASQHCRGFSEAGVPVGLYHFADPDPRETKRDPVLEAEHFAREIYDLAAIDLRPVLDYEERWTRDRAANMAWVWAFVHELERLCGVKPMLYCGASLLDNRLDPVSLVEYGVDLWVADYRTSADRRNAPECDAEWACWQRGSNFRPAWAGGGRVDINAAPSLERLLWVRDDDAA